MPNPKNKKKSRRIEHIEQASEKFYIFCEGIQTEPLYFQGFEKAIKSNPIYKNLVHVHVEGVGADTIRVIDSAEAYVKENAIENANIWCVYDKDSFPKADFNAVSQRAETLNKQQDNVKYYVAWSNECIEFWFILHFAYYDSNNSRKDYRKFLHAKFKELGWTRYEKNNEELFGIMTDKGSPKLAIRYAEKRISECAGKSDTDSAPATKVHLLVKELSKYLPEDIKVKYL